MEPGPKPLYKAAMTDGDTPKKMLTIRPIVPEDRTVWGDLWQSYLAFYETTLPEAVFDSTFSRLLSAEDHEFSGFLAIEDDAAVGLVHYLFHRHAWKIEDVCYLQDLYVRDEARASGAATALIDAVYQAADAKGAPSVYWLTQEFNAGARRLYDRIGSKTPFIRYSRH